MQGSPPISILAPQLALYPNPFGTAVTVNFAVPEGGKATLSVYDVSGRLVRKLVDEKVEPEVQTVLWDGTNNDGVRVGTGVYFVRMVGARRELTHKVALTR